MKKVIALVGLALVLVAGAATVVTVPPQPAMACVQPTC
jgi:hypothetical protein